MDDDVKRYKIYMSNGEVFDCCDDCSVIDEIMDLSVDNKYKAKFIFLQLSVEGDIYINTANINSIISIGI